MTLDKLLLLLAPRCIPSFSFFFDLQRFMPVGIASFKRFARTHFELLSDLVNNLQLLCMIGTMLLLISHGSLCGNISPFVRKIFLTEGRNILQHLLNLRLASFSLGIVMQHPSGLLQFLLDRLCVLKLEILLFLAQRSRQLPDCNLVQGLVDSDLLARSWEHSLLQAAASPARLERLKDHRPCLRPSCLLLVRAEA